MVANSQRQYEMVDLIAVDFGPAILGMEKGPLFQAVRDTSTEHPEGELREFDRVILLTVSLTDESFREFKIPGGTSPGSCNCFCTQFPR